jgi:hypothetical protein
MAVGLETGSGPHRSRRDKEQWLATYLAPHVLKERSDGKICLE